MILVDSARIRRNCGIPVDSCGFPQNSGIPADSGRIRGGIKSIETNKPLFTLENWKTAKHILELIQNGYLSDPPGIPLYTVVGLDKKAGGLPIYRCSRGTNAMEGGVHKHIRARLPKCGASIRHVNAMLHDFVLYHNLVVGKLLFLLNQHF